MHLCDASEHLTPLVFFSFLYVRCHLQKMLKCPRPQLTRAIYTHDRIPESGLSHLNTIPPLTNTSVVDNDLTGPTSFTSAAILDHHGTTLASSPGLDVTASEGCLIYKFVPDQGRLHFRYQVQSRRGSLQGCRHH